MESEDGVAGLLGTDSAGEEGVSCLLFSKVSFWACFCSLISRVFGARTGLFIIFFCKSDNESNIETAWSYEVSVCDQYMDFEDGKGYLSDI
ncbi:Hypothetical protein VS_II1380 [Vibrio atlanticus]|uniref:Uncharacterized protein n=1 Tax=Vibrio atlanticus (strain LGP32) TaxID=575788 RepID=B7VTC6_VIBA3|nr:Hypothetical protein VS_II1380 [Vibrio atlanticus]